MAEMTGSIVPRADGKGSLGLAARPWESVYAAKVVSPTIDAINAALDDKAASSDLTPINTALATKADKSYVDTQLNTKATTIALNAVKTTADAAAAKTYVDQQLATKANTSALASYATKTDLQNVSSSIQSVPFEVDADGNIMPKA